MVAGDTGRIGIIRRARDAKAAVTTRYAKVRQDIRDHLCDLGRSRRGIDALHNKYADMADDPALSNWSREDARLSMDVLASLGRMENKIGGTRFVQAPVRQPHLVLSGVTVSINLSVLMVRERDGKAEVGGVLFRLTKADEETEAASAKRKDIGGFAATLALMQMHNGLAGNRSPHHQLCASFDIQCEDIHLAPRNYATKAKELENGCRFIAAMWDDA